MGENERHFLLSKSDCIQYVYQGIANGDPDIWRMVELVSATEEWITYDTFERVAKLICRDHGIQESFF
jgi:hypothetical protein